MKRPMSISSLGVVLGLGAALVPGGAAAQDPRPPALTNPSADPPIPSLGGAGPSRRLRGGDGEAGSLEGAAQGLAPPGGLYGVDGAAAGAAEDEEVAPGALPEFHVVKKGDTLWSLCEVYFKDPWAWPKLWAQNPLITNPHWIFPGDVVRLRSAGASEPVAAAAPAAAGGGITRTGGALGGNTLMLRTVGYIQAKDLAASAVISGSREEKIMLATGDQAYLTYRKDQPLRAGDRYTIFLADTENPVRNPEDGKVLGYLVRIYGDVVVDQITDGTTARGTLLDLMDPVERGYLVSPLVRQFRRIEPRPSAVNLEVRIVAAFSAARMLSPETFVVLSRGRKDGIEVGNRSFVVRRGDGYRRILESWDKFDPRYPKEVVGELLVVDVRDDTALAWISRSSKEIRVGETVEMRRGH